MKTMNILLACIIALIVVAGGLLVYLTLNSPTVIKPAPSVKLRIGSVPVMEAVILELAQEEGYFAEQGLDAEIVHAESTKYLLPGLANGDLDISLVSIAAGTFNYMTENSEVRIIADAARRKPIIFVREDLKNKIKALEDLKGKKFATPREGSASYYFLAKILDETDIDIADIETKSLEQMEAVTALETKNLDAAIINEPYATIAVEKGIVVQLNDARIKNIFPMEGQQHSFLISTKQFADNKEVLEKFRKAYRKAAALYNLAALQGQEDAKNKVIETIAGYTGVDEKTVENSQWILIDNDAKINKQRLEEIQDYWLEKGLVGKKVDLNTLVVS